MPAWPSPSAHAVCNQQGGHGPPYLEKGKSMKKMSLAFALLVCAAGLTTCIPSEALRTPHDVDRMPDGTTVITDGGNWEGCQYSKILAVDPDGNTLWVYDQDLCWAHNADLQLNGNLIISDTGNDRVIEVDADHNIVWNSDDVTFSDGALLNYPNDANILEGDTVLITDRDNHRAFETDRAGNILWQFGETGIAGGDTSHLNGPHNADRLPNGNTIIADSNNDRIVEVNPAGQVVWMYMEQLNWPRDADVLPNGNVLICDSQNNRILEVTRAGHTVWAHGPLNWPYDADRLAGGRTLVADLMNLRVIELTMDHEVIWEYSWQKAFTLELDASYGAGSLSMDFVLGVPEPAMWATLLILTYPSVSVVPLWTVPLDVIDPPAPLPIGIPLPSIGWVGIYSGLFTEGGVQAFDFALVNTG